MFITHMNLSTISIIVAFISMIFVYILATVAETNAVSDKIDATIVVASLLTIASLIIALYFNNY